MGGPRCSLLQKEGSADVVVQQQTSAKQSLVREQRQARPMELQGPYLCRLGALAGDILAYRIYIIAKLNIIKMIKDSEFHLLNSHIINVSTSRTHQQPCLHR